MTADPREIIRTRLLRALPDGTFCRIDRTGKALFICRIDAETAARLTAEGWQVDSCGSLFRLTPDLPVLDDLRAALQSERPFPPFTARPSDAAVLPLLTALLRAVLLPPAPNLLPLIEKQFRQAVAFGLRSGGGGGLEVCAALLMMLRGGSIEEIRRFSTFPAGFFSFSPK